jgi:hypothetical protein
MAKKSKGRRAFRDGEDPELKPMCPWVCRKCQNCTCGCKCKVPEKA